MDLTVSKSIEGNNLLDWYNTTSMYQGSLILAKFNKKIIAVR